MPEISHSKAKYYGGEERIAHDSGNAMIIGFPGSSSFTGGSWKPEIAVLASLLGGESSIKWSPGFALLSKATKSYPRAKISTKSAVYSDAGLLYVSLIGNAREVGVASKEVVQTIKSIASGEISTEDFKKAVAAAKFAALESGQSTAAGLELTGAGLVHGGQAHQIDEVAKSIDGVSESQLKSVCSLCHLMKYSLILKFRRRKHCWKEELPYPLWVIFICFLLQKRLGSMFDVIHNYFIVPYAGIEHSPTRRSL